MTFPPAAQLGEQCICKSLRVVPELYALARRTRPEVSMEDATDGGVLLYESPHIIAYVIRKADGDGLLAPFANGFGFKRQGRPCSIIREIIG